MLLSPRRKRALRVAARDLIVRLGALAGGVLGFLWALNRPAEAPPASCAGETEAGGIGACANDALLAGLVPYLGGVVVGLLAGAILAILIAHVLVPEPRVQAAAPSAARWITARYVGRCGDCRGPVLPGDRIRHAPGRTLCDRCGA